MFPCFCGNHGIPRIRQRGLRLDKRLFCELLFRMDYTPVSKYRHVYCPGLQRKWVDLYVMFVAEEIYQGFRVATTTGDQCYIKGNAKYFAFPAGGGGGPILIRAHNTPGRMPSSLPLLTGHKYALFCSDHPVEVTCAILISTHSMMNRLSVPLPISLWWLGLFSDLIGSCGSSQKADQPKTLRSLFWLWMDITEKSPLSNLIL